MTTPIRPKDRDAVIQSLRAGVVPRTGQHLIQVGRAREVETLVSDIARLADGGSSFRLVIGEYGAGKTFFLNLVRASPWNASLWWPLPTSIPTGVCTHRAAKLAHFMRN